MMKTLLALTALATLALTGCVAGPYDYSYRSRSYQPVYQQPCQPAYQTFQPAYVDQPVYQPSCGAYQQSTRYYNVPVQALPSRINDNCHSRSRRVDVQCYWN